MLEITGIAAVWSVRMWAEPAQVSMYYLEGEYIQFYANSATGNIGAIGLKRCKMSRFL